MQGFFGGGLQPTQQAIILDHFPPEKRQQAFSLTAVAIIIAPVVGPVLGGYLTDSYSWHWIFLINIPIGIGTFFGVMQFVEDSPTIKEEMRTAPRLDYLGIFFIALALGCLEVGTDRGEDYDWLGSAFIRIIFILSACGFLFGITYLLYVRDPIVNLRVFKDRNFALGSLQIAMMGFVLYASAVLIPQFAQEQLGYTATWAGLVLAPGAVLLTMLIPDRRQGPQRRADQICDRQRRPGTVVVPLLLDEPSPRSRFFSSDAVPRRADRRAGPAVRADQHHRLCHPAARTMNGDAAALFTMARNVFGGIGISVSTALVTEHEQMRQSYLVDHLTAVSQPYNVLLQQIQQGLIDAGQSMAQAAQGAPGQVFEMLQGQSAVLAYADVFLITGCLALVMIPTSLLMSGVKTKARGGAH